MSSANASGDLSSEMEVDAFRCLFLLRFHERHLLESIRPDARKLGKARDTTLALGAVASADGLTLAKIGCTLKNEPVNKGKRKLKLSSIPFSLTCILHKNYIMADPKAEEESIMETLVTVVLDSSFQLVSVYKPDGPVLAYTSAIQDCIALTRQRMKELQKVLNEAISEIEGD